MNKPEIYQALNEQRELVMDNNTGSFIVRQAWSEIDNLLDQLNSLNQVIFMDLDNE
jgi:hypothetical protein